MRGGPLPPLRTQRWSKTIESSGCGGGSNRWVSTELMCERLVVPGVPHFDYVAPRKAKENELLYVEGVSGRRPRSPPTEVVGPPMRAGEVGFGSYDVSLANEEVHVVPKIGEGGETG